LLAALFLFGFAVVMHSPRSALLVHNSIIIVGGAIVVTAGLSVIRRGLSPFRMLQDRLADVRAGRTSRLEGDYPTEVEPLVNDLNTLLEERERLRREARSQGKVGVSQVLQDVVADLVALVRTLAHGPCIPRGERLAPTGGEGSRVTPRPSSRPGWQAWLIKSPVWRASSWPTEGISVAL
jgi:hypothetical protein